MPSSRTRRNSPATICWTSEGPNRLSEGLFRLYSGWSGTFRFAFRDAAAALFRRCACRCNSISNGNRYSLAMGFRNRPSRTIHAPIDARSWGFEHEKDFARFDRRGGVHRDRPWRLIWRPRRLYQGSGSDACAPSWTGFYIFGGAGGGVWDADTTLSSRPSRVRRSAINQRQGGDGWFGTVGAGYDWQSTAAGCSAFRRRPVRQPQRHHPGPGSPFVTGSIKNDYSWAVGARLGYLVAPNVLSYVNGGYTGSHWSGTTLLSSATGTPSGLHTNSFNANGWFVGGGVENNLNIFGISAPGWFMKTEYRACLSTTARTLERTRRRHQHARSAATSPSSRACRPSAPRWSIASTGVARWSPSTDPPSDPQTKAPALSGAPRLLSTSRPACARTPHALAPTGRARSGQAPTIGPALRQVQTTADNHDEATATVRSRPGGGRHRRQRRHRPRHGARAWRAPAPRSWSSGRNAAKIGGRGRRARAELGAKAIAIPVDVPTRPRSPP